MRKTIASLAFGILSAAVMFATTAKQAPETITINECASKKPAVNFPHKAHWKVTECKTCHHAQADLKEGTDVEVQGCATCHLNPEKAETPSCTEMSSAKNPYHMLCVNCHKEKVKEDAASKAPTKCNDCHAK